MTTKKEVLWLTDCNKSVADICLVSPGHCQCHIATVSLDQAWTVPTVAPEVTWRVLHSQMATSTTRRPTYLQKRRMQIIDEWNNLDQEKLIDERIPEGLKFRLLECNNTTMDFLMPTKFISDKNWYDQVFINKVVQIFTFQFGESITKFYVVKVLFLFLMKFWWKLWSNTIIKSFCRKNWKMAIFCLHYIKVS